MRKLILKMSVSVDGFVGGPNGEIDWIFKSTDDGAARWIMDALRKAGLHIMGSRTFYDMAAYWPYANEPFAAPMNEIPKAVFTKKGSIAPLSEALTTRAFKDASLLNRTGPGIQQMPGADSWDQAYVATGDLGKEINRLKQQPGKDILAHGGAGFAQSLVKSGLIDEYQLLTHPVALGNGLPLFSAIAMPVYLKLVNTTTFNSGAMGQVYRPA